MAQAVKRYLVFRSNSLAERVFISLHVTEDSANNVAKDLAIKEPYGISNHFPYFYEVTPAYTLEEKI
jgi:hypothetical protein